MVNRRFRKGGGTMGMLKKALGAKPSLTAKAPAGGRRSRAMRRTGGRRRNVSKGGTKKRRKGGNVVGTAVVPFGLWGLQRAWREGKMGTKVLKKGVKGTGEFVGSYV